MKFIFPILFSVSLLFVSCKKDGNSSPLFNNTIKAGVITPVFMTGDTLTPSLELMINWDSQNLYGFGEDSLDFNQDGIIDFRFTCALLNQDSIHLLNGQMPNPFPYFRITGVNGTLVRLRTEEAPIGLGQTTTLYWADTVGYENQISEKNTWGGTTLNMWQENPSPGTMSFGPWYAVSGTRYIGFSRIEKLGWLEIDATNHEQIKVLSVAYQN